jgi:hypothetical protein
MKYTGQRVECSPQERNEHLMSKTNLVFEVTVYETDDEGNVVSKLCQHRESYLGEQTAEHAGYLMRCAYEAFEHGRHKFYELPENDEA